MGKRKKRLLFDVLDDVVEARQRAMGPIRPPGGARRAPAGASEKRAPLASGSGGPPEIRITRDMGITIVVVVLAFVGCAYYSGMVHGRSAGGDDGSKSLRRSAAGEELDRSRIGEHYAIQACMENYTRYTAAALGAAVEERVAALHDEGYFQVDVYDYPHETEEGWGTLVIWVGRAARRVDLEADAAILRTIQLGDSHPFAAAFVTLFRD